MKILFHCQKTMKGHQHPKKRARNLSWVHPQEPQHLNDEQPKHDKLRVGFLLGHLRAHHNLAKRRFYMVESTFPPNYDGWVAYMKTNPKPKWRAQSFNMT